MSSEEQTSTTTTTKFLIHAKNLFVTFPQCPLDPGVVCLAIQNLFKDKLEYLIIGQEHHQDGNFHLHALIVLKNRYHTTNPRFLDVRGYHPNVQPARQVNQCILYVTKENYNIVSYGIDWKQAREAALKKKSVKSTIMASRLMQGDTIMDLTEENPGFVLMNLKKLLDFQNWWQTQTVLKESLLPFHSCHQVDRDSGRDWELKIVHWINLNFSQKRKHKQPQLWIYGWKDSGKTHLLMTLMKYFHGYEIPDDSNWYDGYNDDYDFAWIDEFKGQKKIQWMNAFVEGRPLSLPQRGTHPYVKKHNMPVIVCSNYPISGCYSKADNVVVDAIQCRFKEIMVPPGERIDIQFEFDASDEDTAPMYSDEEDVPSLVEPEIY